jgi:hypothetical protein
MIHPFPTNVVVGVQVQHPGRPPLAEPEHKMLQINARLEGNATGSNVSLISLYLNGDILI